MKTPLREFDAREQQATCRRLAIPFVPTQPRDVVALAPAIARQDMRVATLHAARRAGGRWIVWSGEDQAKNFVGRRARSLIELCPEIEPYLGLPPGWRLRVHDGNVETWFDAELLIVTQSPPLSARRAARQSERHHAASSVEDHRAATTSSPSDPQTSTPRFWMTAMSWSWLGSWLGAGLGR